jgi:23S rRNA (uridine2552-2'-O)-methyltransferase
MSGGKGGGGVSGHEGGRSLKVRVKSAGKRTLSSKIWLERQLNDPFVARARQEGWRSRAVYKLMELDERYKLFKQGQSIVDLGAAPGGWAQYVAKKVQSAEGRGRVIGIDILEIETLPGVEFEVMDFLEPSAPERLRSRLNGGLAQGVLSDMAANTTGHKKTDHLRIIHLAELAAEFAREVTAPGGFFVAKVFQGGSENDLLSSLKRDYQTVRHVKPKASRADSSELYVLATGFRGAPAQPAPD